MLQIIVASKNPVKIEAAVRGFAEMFPDVDFETSGISLSSDISDQPMSDTETLRGAIGRVRNASRAMRDADYWIGIEGGVAHQHGNGTLECFAWVTVASRNGIVGTARSGAFALPRRVAELIKQGHELGTADDIVFGRSNSKQQNGSVGLLTNNVIDRTRYYTEAVILALIPFRNPELY